MSPFVSKWDSTVLIEVMRSVLTAADAAHPASVTQRAYNSARELVGYGDSPAANKLAARYELPWPTLAQIVVEHPDAARAIANARNTSARQLLTAQEVRSALLTVAARLATSELSPASYEQTRVAINAETKRRHLHGRAAMPLPSIDAIRSAMSFPAAVVDAGLTVSARRQSLPMPRVDAAILFVEHCNLYPSRPRLTWFASYHGIAIAAATSKQPHIDAVAAAKSYFHARGDAFPPSSQGERGSSWREAVMHDSGAIGAARTAYPIKRRAGYSLDEIREAIHQAFDLLRPGERLSARRYREIALAHGLPSMSAIQNRSAEHNTGWVALVGEVAAERAAAMQRLPPSNTPLRRRES